jgi:tetratricopeptide (TPR) repeat protein
MNLAILQRMIREGDLSVAALRYLIECKAECEWLDYKESLTFDHDAKIAAFARDMLAMRNIGGGYEVIGVKDKTWEPVGLDLALPYDGKILRDKVMKATGINLSIDIVQHEITYSNKNRMYGLIYVRSAVARNRRRLPTLVKNDFHPKEAYGLRRGDIYVRRGDETVRMSSQEELESLLDDMDARADQLALDASSRDEAAFAISEGTYRLLERGYESFIGRSGLKQALCNAILGDPRIWIINVNGTGGVGKSALVTEVAYELFNSNEFESIIQLTAKETVLTQEGIRKAAGRSLYSLEDLLDHIASVFEQQPPETLPEKRALVLVILSTWKTLLILDNMETVQDGRILRFIQELPTDTKAKVVLTSRQKTSGWEYPIDVAELTEQEIADFVAVKAASFGIKISTDAKTIEKIASASGGLPLAIEWILGRYAKTGSLSASTIAVKTPDSPILEFSFRNIWNVLGPDAQALLVILTTFDSPPDVQQLAVATEWSYERIESSLKDLRLVTLVREITQESDGRVTYSTLPITLSFAAQQSDKFGNLEIESRRRTQHFTQKMQLLDYEMGRFKTIFSRYQITNENEQRAVILVRRGESATFRGRSEEAAALFQQARDLAPLSGYVYAMSANFELSRGKVGTALRFANDACKKANRATGGLCFDVKARVLDSQHDKEGTVGALRQALEYDPEDVILRHKFGVALSRSGRTSEAIMEFSKIISAESSKISPTDTLIMAYKTRIINYRRLGNAEQAARDLAEVERLLAENPSLQRFAYQIADLRSDT